MFVHGYVSSAKSTHALVSVRLELLPVIRQAIDQYLYENLTYHRPLSRPFGDVVGYFEPTMKSQGLRVGFSPNTFSAPTAISSFSRGLMPNSASIVTCASA